MNNRGDTAAVWQGSPVQQQDPFVVAAARPADGRWHIEEIPSLIAGDLGGPALDAAGNATVAWDQDDSLGTVRTARRPVGDSWEPSVVVSEADNSGYNPEVAMGGDGTTTVVWSRFLEAGGYQDVQGVQRTPEGTWGEAHSLSNGRPDDPWGGVNVAMDAQGHTVVVWTEIDGTTPRVMAATR
jgi:hypothetical protein